MKSLVALTLLAASAVAFAADGGKQSDKAAIDAACSADAQTAGCGGETVGKGLLKCLAAHKKSNKDFKVSDACRAAIKQGHEDRAEKKQ